jgi:hypothetical protein
MPLQPPPRKGGRTQKNLLFKNNAKAFSNLLILLNVKSVTRNLRKQVRHKPIQEHAQK